jgi:hypothetical protein
MTGGSHKACTNIWSPLSLSVPRIHAESRTMRREIKGIVYMDPEQNSKLFAHGVSLILQAILTSGGGMLFGIFDGHGGAACGQASP